MPRRKSVPSLQELCFKITTHHLKKLQHQGKLLPEHFVNELYNRCYLHVDEKGRKKIDFQLPSNLFLQPKLNQLHNLNFDLEHAEVIKMISRDCKNLQRIILHPQTIRMSADSLAAITMNNSLIVHIDIREFKGLTDHHLILISKHCPQLQYLNLRCSKEITDECMSQLPVNLIHLDLTSTEITPNGCLLALNRLKHLKELKCLRWMAIFQLLQLQQPVKSTFSIERIFFEDSYRNFRIDKAVFDMFPKLQNIGFVMFPIANFLTPIAENKKQNLITDLCINFLPVDVILFVGQFCPMLEKITAKFSGGNFPNETDILDPQVPFKHLRKLQVDMRDMLLSLCEIEVVLTCLNSKLQSLVIECWPQFEGVIDDLLEVNLLQKLETVRFLYCHSLTVAKLKKLLTSLDSLKCMDVHYCRSISRNECQVLEKVVSEMNLDVNLDLRV